MFFLNIFFVYVMLTRCLGITFPHVESICSLSHYAQGFVHPMWWKNMNSVLPNRRDRMIDCSHTPSLCAESYLENFMLIGGLGEVVWKISIRVEHWQDEFWEDYVTHRIHGTNGIFTYMKTIKINHSNVGKYNVRPMDPMGFLFFFSVPACGCFIPILQVSRSLSECCSVKPRHLPPMELSPCERPVYILIHQTTWTL